MTAVAEPSMLLFVGRGAAKRPAASAAGGANRVSRAAYGLVKVVGLLVGGSAALMCLSAVAGLVHPSPYVRIPIALLFGAAVPLVLVSRLLPDSLERKTEGLTTDVLAVGWSAIAFLVAGVLHAQTRPWLEAEATRLEREAGGTIVGPAARWLAGLSTSPAGSASSADDTVGAGGTTASAGGSALPAGGGAPSASPAPRGRGGATQPREDAGAGGAPSESPGAAGGAGTATTPTADAGTALGASIASPGAGAGGGAAEPALDWRSVEDAISASVVTIAVGTPTGVRSVTGVCVGQAGQVVTVYEPIATARAMAVRQPDGFWVRGGARIDADPGQDLALIRVRGADAMTPLPLRVAARGAPSLPRSGRCLASPLGLGLTQVDVAVRPSSGPEPSWLAQPIGRRRCDPGSLVVELSGAFFGIVPSEPLLPSQAAVVRLTKAEAIAAMVGATRRPAPVPIAALAPGELW